MLPRVARDLGCWLPKAGAHALHVRQPRQWMELQQQQRGVSRDTVQ